MCLPHVLLSENSPLCAVLHAELLLSAYSVNGNPVHIPGVPQNSKREGNVHNNHNL